MWARQLLALQIRNPSGIEIISDFTGMAHYTGVEIVELVMFNCPELGIAVMAIGRINTRGQDIGRIIQPCNFM